MRQREAAVDFRFRGILRREEIVEFFFRIDHARVRIAEGEGAVEKILLDRVEQLGRCLTNSGLGRNDLRRFAGVTDPGYRKAVAPADGDLPLSRSRGPSSTRNGTPFLIHSQFFTPPPRSR